MATASSKGTVLQVDISGTLTTIVGVRNLDFKSPEVEFYDADDITDAFVTQGLTGRTSGGSASFEKFMDPAAATHTVLVGLINTPAIKDWRGIWSTATPKNQDFTGALKNLNQKAARGDALMEDGEITITSAPTLA